MYFIIIKSLIYLINKTQFGLNVRAIACNAYAAKVLGVKVDRCIASVFMLAGALAGVAGVLYGMKYNVFPTMGNVGLKAFIASVIGGLGSAVSEAVCEEYPVPVVKLGVEDTFGKSGPAVELLHLFGLDAEHIVEKAKLALSLKK